MKDLQIIQKNGLIILKEIKRVCDKHNIRYHLSCGSLLGAIRHDGFIPWDDDVDVEMPLPDYRKFLKVCETELDSRFFLQTFVTDPNYYHGFAKIRMNGTTFMPVHHTKHKIHHGFWVDVFPVVRVPKNERLFKLKNNFISVIKYIQMGNYIEANFDDFSALLGKKMRVVLAVNKLPVKFRILIHKFLLSFVFKKPRKGFPIACMDLLFVRIPTYTFDESINHKFEDDYFSITGDWEEYLVTMYGDYMELPPEDERRGHGVFIVDENNNYTQYLDEDA